mgnify:CR=1 FL=1
MVLIRARAVVIVRVSGRVGRVAAVLGGVRLHVHLTEHSREIVLEDMSEDLRRDPLRRVVKVQRATEARDPVAERLRVRPAALRPGDPALLVADTTRIRAELGWQPRHSALETILSHALQWEWQRSAAT